MRALSARQRHRRLAEPRRRAARAEPPQPAQVRRVECRAHHQRAVRVERGAQALADHAGRGQRVGEARRDPAGVALRGAFAGPARVEDDHLGARARQLVRAGDADHAGAHHGHPHGFGPRAFQAGSQSTSAASRSPAICRSRSSAAAPLGRDAARAARRTSAPRAPPRRRSRPGRTPPTAPTPSPRRSRRSPARRTSREDPRELGHAAQPAADRRHQRPPAERRRHRVGRPAGQVHASARARERGRARARSLVTRRTGCEVSSLATNTE